MKRLVILGCPGSGKSTLARQLSERTGLPVVHLDRLNWRPGWQAVSREEFDRLLAEEMAKERWIIDGNYSRTIPDRLKHCDTAVYLDYPRLLCLFGAIRRVVKGRGRTRSDMGAGCPERLNGEFLRYIWCFRKEQQSKIMRCLETARGQGVQVLVLKNRRQTRRFLSQCREL